MDYLHRDHSLTRISGQKSLPLPLSVRAQETHQGMLPVISGGRVVNSRRGAGVVIRDEATFDIVGNVYDREYVASVYNASDGSVMVTDDDRNAYVLSLENGRFVERFESACLWPPGDLIEGKGALQVYKPFAGKKLMDPSYLAYFKEVGGQPVWTFSPEIGEYGYAVSGDKLIYRTRGGTFYLLELFTANVLWKKTPRELGYLSDEDEKAELGSVSGNPRIFRDLVITAMHGYVVAFRLETGEVVWKRRGYSGGFNPCVSEDGVVYWVWYERIAHKKKAFDLWHFAILDALTGKELKLFVLNPPESDAEKKIFTRPLSNGEHMYGDVTTTHYWCALYGGLLLAINLETGAIDWHYDFKAVLYPRPFIICNNRLYIQTLSTDYVFEGAGGYRPD